MPNEKFRAYVAVYLILRKREEVLLLLRKGAYYGGHYSLVSGHIDGNETMTHAMIREAKEESGIEMAPEDLRVVHVMHRHCPDREYVDVYFEATKWNGEPRNLEPEKCGELTWHSVSNLPTNIVPEVKSAFLHIQKNSSFSELGWEHIAV